MSPTNQSAFLSPPRRRLVLVASGIALFLAGCGGRQPTGKAGPSGNLPNHGKTEVSSQPAPASPPALSADPTPSAPAEKQQPADPIPDSPPNLSAEKEVPIPDAVEINAAERVLLLTAGGPIILELRLLIGGQPHQQAFDRLLDAALLAADADGDGRAMWSELLESKKFRYGQYGNLPIADDNAKKQLRERYDMDQDLVVDRDELPRLLTRNAGLSRAFSLRSVAEVRRGAGRETSLWRLLDNDDDGALSGEELAAAPVRLRQSDSDDDDLLSQAELRQPTALDLENRGESRLRRGDVARLLGSNAQWDSVQLALEERYALGGRLKPVDLGWSEAFFEHLDENHDGRLIRKEYSRFNQIAPQLVIAVDFAGDAAPVPETAPSPKPSPADAVQNPSRLRLLSLAPPLAERGVSAVVQNERLVVRAAGTTLVFFLNDTLAGTDLAAQAAALLQTLDADNNGYLEEAELPPGAATQLPQFAAADANEDGKIYPDEIAAFLRQQQAAQRAQIHARAELRGDPLFGFLDRNSDDQLDPRELQAAAARLAELDSDGDGQVLVSDLPEALTFCLARGSIENQDELFRPPSVTARVENGAAPRWFTAMDQNGDGALSPREFLGEADDFEKLDRNRDGLIDLSEGAPPPETTP